MSWVTSFSGVCTEQTFHVHCSLSGGQAAGSGASGLCANQISLLKLEATKQNVHMDQVCRNVSQTPNGGAGGSRMGTDMLVRDLANTRIFHLLPTTSHNRVFFVLFFLIEFVLILRRHIKKTRR